MIICGILGLVIYCFRMDYLFFLMFILIIIVFVVLRFRVFVMNCVMLRVLVLGLLLFEIKMLYSFMWLIIYLGIGGVFFIIIDVEFWKGLLNFLWFFLGNLNRFLLILKICILVKLYGYIWLNYVILVLNLLLLRFISICCWGKFKLILFLSNYGKIWVLFLIFVMYFNVYFCWKLYILLRVLIKCFLILYFVGFLIYFM